MKCPSAVFNPLSDRQGVNFYTSIASGHCKIYYNHREIN